ncbi:ATP-binding cassette domain-containing protein [Haloimpatiens sp. FM7315]|uniref:ATP-binding cassette domain-containing protein n=1 Tax=Haloimpatiens sp. FM7315 TaxID=3298609 RepID=UPI0035A3A0E6
MKRYISKLKLIIFIKVLTDSLYVIAIASIPYIIKMLIDYDFSKGSKGVVIFILMYLLAASTGMGFQYISQLYGWKLQRKFNLLIKKDIFNSILNYSYTKFNSKDISTYISILNNDVKVVEQYVSSIVSIVQSAIQVVIYGIYMFALGPIIAIVIILCSLLTLFLPNLTSKTLSKRRLAHLDMLGLYIGKVKDLLEGFKNVNYETKDNILEEHDKTMLETENKLLFYGKFNTFTNVFNGFFMYLLDISAFTTVAILLLKNKISIGTATAALAYIKEFVYPIRYIISDLTNIKSAKSTKDKLLNFINYHEERLDTVTEFKSSIEFSNVTVEFDNFELNNFNYKFEKGKKYAIIGHSGSGKSTIINLLMKYLMPSNGKIIIDGTNIKDIDTTGIIGCVNQFEHVFSSDFLSNVTVYSSYLDNNLKNIIDYCECDKIHHIINKEDCTGLSGGEKQLLALVKMMLINKDIILLDEPFSALDIQNTLLIQDKVYSLKNKTMIVVTHDLSENNLKYFDEVIIMNNGCIKKSTTSNEIIKSKEYANLIKTIE